MTSTPHPLIAEAKAMRLANRAAKAAAKAKRTKDAYAIASLKDFETPYPFPSRYKAG